MATKTAPTSTNGVPLMLSALDILTLSQAAAYLQVSTETVRSEAEAGRIPGRCLDGEWRFIRGAIADWLGTPLPQTAKSQKARIQALIGVWKDDPTVEAMVEEIYRDRKRHTVGG